LTFLVDNKAQDLGVADQQRGLMTECDWLEFAKLPFGKTGGKVSACWFFDAPRVASGVHFRGKSIDLATPPGWEFEESLSHRFGFVRTGQEEGRLKFLRSDDSMDVFLDQQTGKEVFECIGVVQHLQLTLCNRAKSLELTRTFSLEQCLSILALERLDHRAII